MTEMLTTLPENSLVSEDSLATLPRDIIIIIAQFVYGDENVKMRKNGTVSFRILNIAPCMYLIPKFTVYIRQDARTGVSSVDSKIVVLGNKTTNNRDEGWYDNPWATVTGEPVEYRRKEYSMKITNGKCEFIANLFVPVNGQSTYQNEMIMDTTRSRFFIK